MSLSAALRTRGFWNLFSLYISLAINAVVSLALIAYLARVLGPQTWGVVLLAQAFGYWVSMLPEYGFGLSASRDIAQARDSARGSAIAYSVTWGKALLAFLILPLAGIAYFLVPAFNAEPVYLAGCVLFAVLQGFDTMWLFLGTERQYIYAILSSAARLLVLALVFLLVEGPADGWAVMPIQALGALIILAGGLIYLGFAFPFRRVGKADVRDALGAGWKLFQFRGAQSITANSSVVLLGIVSPRGVEAFGSAERIMRNCLGLLGPIAAAGMPRIARLIGSDAEAARRTARLSFAVTLGFGIVAGALLLVFAPWVVSVLLGPGYEFVVPILRIVAVAMPFAAAGNMLAVQWLLPLGLDRTLVRITLAAGLLNVAGCLLLGRLYGATGAAATLVAVEAGMALALAAVIRRSSGSTFW